MKKIILLVGKSGTGKTHIINSLCLRKVVPYTTRPMREGEIDGISYNFITKEECENTVVDDIVAATNFDGHTYFAKKDSLKDKEVYVVDPSGVHYYLAMIELESNLPMPVIVYLEAPWYRRLYRIMKREGFSLESLKIAIRRLRNDRKKFGKLEGQFPYSTIRT